MHNETSEHIPFMQECFKLANQAKGDVSPNPLVGSVIVKDNKIIAKGYHKKAGKDHAELDAIKNATEDIKGATLYCNLEPCCHTNKRTPPCAQRIIQEGIAKVIISNLDPNPQVAGKGLRILEEAGIETHHGVLKEEGLRLNEIFFKHIVEKEPFINLKMAQTLDGKTATRTGDSKWITSKESRLDVHQDRSAYDAILIGAQTARADDPSLTIRIPGDETKVIKRIILSRSGDLSPKLKLFNDEYKDKTILVIPENIEVDIETTIIHCPTIYCPTNGEHFDLKFLVQVLYNNHDVTSIYTEGGSITHTEFIKQDLYDRITIYTAPKLLGVGKSVLGDLNINKMKDTLNFTDVEYTTIGDNLKFSARKK